MSQIQDGVSVIAELESQVAEIVKSGRTPKVMVIGSYYYFLLKSHYLVHIATKVNPFFPMQEFEVAGYKLEVCEKPRNNFGSVITAESSSVKVYGE